MPRGGGDVKNNLREFIEIVIATLFFTGGFVAGWYTYIWLFK